MKYITDPARTLEVTITALMEAAKEREEEVGDEKAEKDEIRNELWKYHRKAHDLSFLFYKARKDEGLEWWGEDPEIALKSLKKKIKGTEYEHILKALEETGEEEPIAPKLMARILEERLPTAAYRIALLIHAYEQGKIPRETLLKYLETLHSPHTPHGTATYNLIHHLINYYEEKVANNETLIPTSKALRIVLYRLGLPPYKDPLEILEQAARGEKIHPRWITTKINTGIPLPPSKAARAVKNLIENLEKLEKGLEDPEELDTKLELAILANTIPGEPREPGDLKQRIHNPDLLRETFRYVMEEYFQKAHQLGREEEEKLLRETAEIVAKHLEETPPSQPYYKTIAQAMKKVQTTLKARGYDEKDAAFAANIAQHLLLTLPIHAIEGEEELPKAKAILLEGYTPQNHETPPIVRGLHSFYQRLRNAKTKEEKEEILARLRDSFNTLEAYTSAVHRTLETIRKEKEESPRRIGEALYHSIRPVSRVIR